MAAEEWRRVMRVNLDGAFFTLRAASRHMVENKIEGAVVVLVDIGDVRGQMDLFDRLVADTASTKVIDVGYGPFEQFFSVIGDIGFAQEARRRGMDMIVFFLTDQAMATVRIYPKLQERVPATFTALYVVTPAHVSGAASNGSTLSGTLTT